jgi:molybdate transport system ATP-binding protein
MSLDLDFVVRLDDFSLSVATRVEAGETVAIVGPNGVGKTTLLKTITGLVAVDEGSIVVDGATMDRARTNEYVPPEHRGVGVVFQDYLLFEHMSMLENVAFGLRAHGHDKRAARERARALIATIGLSDFVDRRPSELSGGQRQRVALMRALAIEPRILLLDEPLSAIDRDARAELRDVLAGHIRSFAGITLLVTHDPDDVVSIAERVIVLDAGRVTWDGPVGDDAWRSR